MDFIILSQAVHNENGPFLESSRDRKMSFRIYNVVHVCQMGWWCLYLWDFLWRCYWKTGSTVSGHFANRWIVAFMCNGYQCSGYECCFAKILDCNKIVGATSPRNGLWLYFRTKYCFAKILDCNKIVGATSPRNGLWLYFRTKYCFAKILDCNKLVYNATSPRYGL